MGGSRSNTLRVAKIVQQKWDDTGRDPGEMPLVMTSLVAAPVVGSAPLTLRGARARIFALLNATKDGDDLDPEDAALILQMGSIAPPITTKRVPSDARENALIIVREGLLRLAEAVAWSVNERKEHEHSEGHGRPYRYRTDDDDCMGPGLFGESPQPEAWWVNDEDFASVMNESPYKKWPLHEAACVRSLYNDLVNADAHFVDLDPMLLRELMVDWTMRGAETGAGNALEGAILAELSLSVNAFGAEIKEKDRLNAKIGGQEVEKIALVRIGGAFNTAKSRARKTARENEADPARGKPIHDPDAARPGKSYKKIVR